MKLTLKAAILSFSQAQTVLESICFRESPRVGDISGTPFDHGAELL